MLVENIDISEIVKMNIAHFDNGIYFVKMFSETGTIATKRLVIIK